MPDLANLAVKRLALRLCALPVVVLVRLTLTVISHRAILKLMPPTPARPAPAAMGLRFGEAVRSVARWIPGASCLTQALATQLLLAARGYSSVVRVGVKQSANGTIEAHAWLMTGQVIVTGGSATEIASFAPLTDLPHKSH